MILALAYFYLIPVTALYVIPFFNPIRVEHIDAAAKNLGSSSMRYFLP